MGQKDSKTKKYMSNPERFADFFNGVIFGGEDVIKPENLEQKDVTSIVIPFQKGRKSTAIQKYRDILKSCVLMKDEEIKNLSSGIKQKDRELEKLKELLRMNNIDIK